jgi:hypothetical protein
MIGALNCELKKFEIGLRYLKIAIRLDTEDVQVWSNIALAHRRLGRHSTALDVAKRGALLAPGDPSINLFVARYIAAPELDPALVAVNCQICDWALILNPDSFEAFYCSAGVAKALGQYDLAASFMRRSICLCPDSIPVLMELAGLLAELTRGDAATLVYGWAFRISPHNHDILYHLALVQLRQGCFEKGWTNYESRWLATVGLEHLQASNRIRSSRPMHEDLSADKRVLLWGEQGVGDEVMFGSLIAEFMPRCRHLLVQIDPRLVSLFSRAYPQVRFFGHDEEVPVDAYDEQLPLGSLGRLLRPTKYSFSGKGGRFLAAAVGSAKRVRQELAVDENELLVGLCWRSTNPENRRIRSIPIEYLLSAIPDDGQRFLNLQYGNVSAEMKSLSGAARSRLVQHSDVDLTADLEGVSSLIEACDLVITVGNTVAHLAGALGKKTFVLLPQVAGWRWMHGTTQCVWYDSIKLIRQDRRGEWENVLASINSFFVNKACL